MINYEFIERGKFTIKDFDEKIEEALSTISRNLEIENLNFKEVRHSSNQGYTINREEFCGTYITIEISSKEKIFGYINCFMDNNKDFIEISSSSSK